MPNSIQLKHPIDPTLDFVFNELFNSKDNDLLVIDFINAMTKNQFAITKVKPLIPHPDHQHIQPATMASFETMDVKGKRLIFDIHLDDAEYIDKKMTAHWALTCGEQDENDILTVNSIWLVKDNSELYQDFSDHHHIITMSTQDGIVLLPDFEMHMFELQKWQMPNEPKPEDLWLSLLSGTQHVIDNPDILANPAMGQAILKMQDIATVSSKFDQYSTQKHIKEEVADK